ncbi:MAG: hypothetical protein ACOYT4_04885 [Nanoarchaeota archaeon]
MGWFDKKEKIPELPRITKLPELPDLPEPPKMNANNLPSLPRNSTGENLNQELVKSAVYDSGENEVNVEELPRDFNFQNFEEKIPAIPDQRINNNYSPSKPLEIRQIEVKPLKPSLTANEPIFVRMDKFSLAKKNFEEINKKVKEIENVLKKVKELKIKEDAEILEWTEDIEKIKSRLSEVDSNIFANIK